MTSIVTGVGRIVWGHPLKAVQRRDVNTKQPLFKDGQPVMVHQFGVAFPKAEFGPIWAVMDTEAKTGYPQGIPPRFSWKYVDGDGIDSSGKPYNAREGYAGCYVIAISSQSGFPPNVVAFENNAYRQLTDQEIKTGDYVVCGLDFKVNVPTDRTHTPGLYVNPNSILRVGYGQAIVNAPDPTQVFGAAPQQYALPPGASAMPQAPATGFAAGMPAQQPYAAPAAQPGYPQQAMPGQMPAGMPGQMPAGMPGYPQQAMPGQMPAGMPGQMPAGMPGYPQQAMPGQMPAGMPGQMPAGMPGQMPAGMPGQMPAPATGFAAGMPAPATGFAAGMPAQQPYAAPAAQPGYPQQAMPGQMPAGMPGQIPAGMPGYPQQAMPGQMPAGMPGQMPGR